MKLSLNWLQDYVDLDGYNPAQVSEMLTDLGLEVEGEEKFESVQGGLQGIVIGEVVSREKHPNADKLSVCEVNIGTDEPLNIVCGAPNVAAGQKVVVATIGTTLYTPEGEAWKIKKGKIRGEVSEGMICAEDELGLGQSHEGIMVLPNEIAVGTLAKDYFKIENDVVFEIGLTPNRSDGTNHIGSAKDLAATLKINHGHSGLTTVPSVDDFKVDNNSRKVEVVVENTEACPRYSGISIQNLEIKPSPEWLQNKLKAIGVRPINNVVDITNFVLNEVGQPLHAFDLDEIKGNKIIVKTLKQGTKFLALDETEKSLSAEDLMICDGDSNGMCIGGVFGGLNSGVKDNTTSIFLESAHFNARFIRRSKTRHNLHTDAAYVFEKGSDPNITVYALKRAALLIKELAGGEICSELIDIYPTKLNPKQIEVSYGNVNRLIGVDLSNKEIEDILEAMEMEIVDKNETQFTVAVPTNKADVLREADIIEEILRVYGLNKVPIPTQVHSSLVFSKKPDRQALRNSIGELLVGMGFNEMMALSLTESKYYKELYPVEEENLILVNNTSNKGLDTMRPTMVFGGLEAILKNQNRQNPNVKFFEFGKTYIRHEGNIKETEHLALFLSGQRLPESWINEQKKGVDFYTLKAYVEKVLTRLGFGQMQSTALNSNEFAYALKYHRGPQDIVTLGMVQTKICKSLGIKNQVFYASFNWDNIIKALKKHKVKFEALNKYPRMRRDLALVLDQGVKFEEIETIARKTGKKLLKETNLFDVYTDTKVLGENKKSYAVSFTFENKERTLKDKEVDKIMNQLIKEYEDKLKAIIRR